MGKLNFLGIGPKIAIVFIPWLTSTIIISANYTELFAYTSRYKTPLLITGIVLMASGLVIYFYTARLLLKGLRETTLIKTGPYKLCQNPLYSSILLCIIPALSFLLNSWLVLTTSVAGYVLFKIFIRHEYKELEKFFGQEYLIYRKSTPEFFPVFHRKRSFHAKR
jgi:protein-S-isoprenylcysteine O-methyltransferase Ste14